MWKCTQEAFKEATPQGREGELFKELPYFPQDALQHEPPGKGRKGKGAL